MTMLDERARALRWAGEFLREVRACEQIPKDLREQARRILRHYPSAQEIEREATYGRKPGAGRAPWIGLEEVGRDAKPLGDAGSLPS